MASAQFLLSDEPSEDFAGEKMSRDAEIGLHALEQANHGLDVKAIHGQARARMTPGLISAVIQQAQNIRRALCEGYVRLVVKALEEFAGVLHRVDVFDNAIATSGQSFFQGLRSAEVPCARGCRQEQNARLDLHAGGLLLRRHMEISV